MEFLTRAARTGALFPGARARLRSRISTISTSAVLSRIGSLIGTAGPNHIARISGPNHIARISGPNHIARVSGPSDIAGRSGPMGIAGGRGPDHIARVSAHVHRTRTSGDRTQDR